MSGRLASFRGPSTPSASPVQVKQNFKSPSSPGRVTESTYHRKVRALLQELRSTCETWDDLILVDGMKAVKGLADTRTELDNQLALVPEGKQPQSRIVGEKLASMESRIEDLDNIIRKLRKQFQKMNAAVDAMERLLADAHKTKGWAWVHEEPLWVTWTLEKFVTRIPDILHPYHRSLRLHGELVNSLRSHSVSFEVSRDAMARWVEQPWLEEDGWDGKWEDLCSAEIERWDSQ
ncbi:hypothetical protein DENSPDRAFT_394263 [Dentipellis sp. KUC8613]|nr:hypothetical protein DENSPDRAFT_394263 [Dentipellis sp. KUC8613]